ncbi:MAG: glycoside hydrolase family 97 protein [Bacteroidales bacterium]|nr:glycoside hydrolase family 97 protein [Bacteroidales bacterium]
MKKSLYLYAAIIICAMSCRGVSPEVESFSAMSPDGLQKIEVRVQTADSVTSISYSTWYDGQEVVLPSKMDLTVDNHVWEHALGRHFEQPAHWFDNLRLEGCDTLSRDTTWHNAYGERSEVRDAFNGLLLHFAKHDGSAYRLDIEIRAYDEGVAFRYSLPPHPDAIYHRIRSDNTEFALPAGTLGWYTAWAQGPYELRPLSGWEDECERPLTLKLGDSLWAAVGEAAQVGFPRAKLRLSEEKLNTLVTALNDDGTDLVTPYTMPWRVVMAAPSAGKLLEHNDIYLNLNEPSKISDESWIRPGKIMRETTLTTEGALAVIDFCAAHNLQYLLFDWLWYGPAYDFDSDARTVIDKLDMPKVVSYGRQKSVGIWVYVNQHALQKQAAEVFPVLHDWGIVGVKFGFVQFTSQHWSEWVHSLVRLAADNHLMVNIHDEYRPTGYSRTYPNLLTQEGIRGNEEFPSASHNTVLPFTRSLCGPADYTVCYFDPRLVHTTHAHQLALPVVIFSPLQTLYWYDYPGRIAQVEELEFFDAVPTVWDDTRVLDDAMGEHIAVARRSGPEWYVGILNGEKAVTESIATGFLKPGQDYVANIYTDDPECSSPTGVRVSRYIVSGGDVLTFNLLATGGAAIRFVRASASDLKEHARLTADIKL